MGENVTIMSSARLCLLTYWFSMGWGRALGGGGGAGSAGKIILNELDSQHISY